MSGVAGGNRILKQDVQATFNKYVDEVLKNIPGFKRASLSGSVKAGSKADFGDLDIITWFEGEDKKEVKQRIIDAITKLPNNIIVPFKSEKYTGRRYYNSGELISVLFPIEGKADEFIQVDNIIALTEEESAFKGSFLDLPAEKQGLLIGLAKVILLEENPEDVFRRMGISGLPKLVKGEEYEFNLSSVKLSLRKVKLENFKEISREEVWSTTNWGTIKILFKGFNIDGSFEDLLDDISKRLTNPRSKNRVAGIFKSMVSVKSGEVGTAKGKGKEDALEKVAQTLSEALDDQTTTVAIYAGGFKPPHLAHFENAKFLGGKADLLKIYIGRGKQKRLGVEITPEQSLAIWQIYAKYIATPVEVEISPKSPITDTYDWVKDNQSKVDKIVTGAIATEIPAKFGTFIKNQELFPKVDIVELPVIEDKEDRKLSGEGTEGAKISGTTIRTNKDYLSSGKWIPSIVSKQDKQDIIDIVTPKEEPSIEDKMADTIDEVFASFFPETVNKKQVKEGASGTPIAASSAISSKDRADLENLYQELRRSIDTHKFNLDFQQDRIYITRVMDSQLGWDYTPYQKTMPENIQQEKFDYTPYIASLLEYMLDQKMNITPLPEIKIRYDENEANNFFGKTAYYDPNNKEVVLYAMGRHPKDVCRSFAHEMIHHMQNIEGRLGNIQTTNTNEDSHLQGIEDEAYLEGNRVFRNLEDKIKNSKKKEVMAEGRYDKLSNTVSSDIFRAWKEGYEQGKVVVDYNESYDTLGDSFDVDAKMLLIKGYGKIEVHEDTGAGTDDGGDYIIVRMIIDPEMLPEFWEEISMTLKDIARHEIEHLTHQGGGFTANPAKIMRGDQARRDKIKAGEIPVNQYFKLKKEIDANLQGMLFRAKKEKRPFADVVNNYLDSQDITPKQKEEILTLWRNRMPALGLKQTL
jgi:nicotinamide mononucleotide adenylyltransferase/putative lipoic acid-binding regulatory protein